MDIEGQLPGAAMVLKNIGYCDYYCYNLILLTPPTSHSLMPTGTSTGSARLSPQAERNASLQAQLQLTFGGCGLNL